MSERVTVTIPAFEDLEEFKKLGTLVFTLEQMGSKEEIKKAIDDMLNNRNPKSKERGEEREETTNLVTQNTNIEI
jgi:hypothetical protein